MKKIFCYLLLLLFLACQYASGNDIKDFDKHFQLLPRPQKIEILTGKGINSSSLGSIFLNGTSQKPVLYGVLNTLPLSNKSGPGVLEMNISNDQLLPSSTEGYILEIKNGGVIINARSQAGLFYGSQTLLQMLEEKVSLLKKSS